MELIVSAGIIAALVWTAVGVAASLVTGLRLRELSASPSAERQRTPPP